MSDFFDDMGLEMDNCVLRSDALDLYASKTLMLGTHINGGGIHLYNVIDGVHSNLVCAVYRMNGVIESHEFGTAISIAPFKGISKIEEQSANKDVLDFLKANNFEFEVVSKVPTPVDPISPYDGPRLEDLTLPSPF